MAELRIPPGRAGQLKLRHSLAVARRGADLLDQKLRILRERHGELLAAERATADRWQQAMHAAEQWLLRGLLLDGERAVEEAATASTAAVDFGWSTLMGVRHPADARTVAPDADPGTALPANTALFHAAGAYRQALAAAADHATARAAARRIGAEAQRTGRRLQALERHWIPRLERALARTELALEQAEHEDAVRRRWASSADGSPGAGLTRQE